MNPLLAQDATEQARAVRAGEVTPRELVGAAIEAIEKHDLAVNAVSHRRFEEALAEADTVEPSAPFAGVPILIKAMDAVRGAPADLGSEWLARVGRTADADSPVVAVVRRAGFVVVGLSAAPEFGLVSATESALHGITRNPWDLDRTSGGSSGGASAAVSAGMVAIAAGGDGGGSIRMPAAFCHLVGLKPSLGLAAGRESSGDRWGHSVPSVVTRSVRDSAAAMDLLADRGHRSLRLPPTRVANFAEAAITPPGRLRVGVVTRAPSTAPPVEDDVAATVEETALLLESFGHRVETAHPAGLFDPRVLKVFFDSLSVTVSETIDELSAEFGPPRDGELDPVVSFWDRRGREMGGVALAAALSWQRRYRARMDAWWDDFDLLLSPVFASAAKPVSWPWLEPGGLQRSVDVLTFTAPFNTTGQPAISVPGGLTSTGLPIGIQLAAGFGRDDLLLQVATQIEAARPWVSIAPAFRG